VSVKRKQITTSSNDFFLADISFDYQTQSDTPKQMKAAVACDTEVNSAIPTR
jgi:hypothetical protein